MGTLSNTLPCTCLHGLLWTCFFCCVIARPSDIYNSGMILLCVALVGSVTGFVTPLSQILVIKMEQGLDSECGWLQLPALCASLLAWLCVFAAGSPKALRNSGAQLS